MATLEPRTARSPALECIGLTKSFGATQALKGVNLVIERGEAVALLGHNGAGKSTLVNIVSGVVGADSGSVKVGGRPLTEPSPAAANQLGVAAIHQELSFVGPMNVAENLFLSRLPTHRRFPLLLDRRRLYREAREVLREIAPGIDVHDQMASLRVGARQLIEIARALASGASLILMDEPTAALNAAEVETLFETVAKLKAVGVGVLYISHRIDEVEQVADSVVVLRDGRSVAEHPIGKVTRQQLVNEIVGRELEAFVATVHPAPAQASTEAHFQVREVAVAGSLRPITFEVHKGEILGLYGLAGSGVELVAPALFGAIPASGEVVVMGRRLRRRDPARCRDAGLALVPAERRLDALIPALSLSKNMTIASIAKKGSATLVRARAEREEAVRWIRELDIRPPEPDISIVSLSGGNQQKSVFARWLTITPKVFLLDDPTRGVDVSARLQMYRLIEKLASEGAAIVLVSSEASEIASICHRVGVVYRGDLLGPFDVGALDEQRIVELAIQGSAA